MHAEILEVVATISSGRISARWPRGMLRHAATGGIADIARAAPPC
ncbi:hypothetical protein [Neoroseomonas eburnea]|nr:hypothetical protein [Neoroseomonas eburnea]